MIFWVIGHPILRELLHDAKLMANAPANAKTIINFFITII